MLRGITSHGGCAVSANRTDWLNKPLRRAPVQAAPIWRCSLAAIAVTLVLGGTAAAQVASVDTWTTGLAHDAGVGSDRLLVFMVGYEGGTDVGISTVTYGSQSLTRIDGAVAGTTLFARVEFWYLDEVGIGAASGNTFVVTYGGATPSEQHFAAGTYANVDQITPIFHTATNFTNGSTPNPLQTTVNVVANGLALGAAIAGNTGSFTWGNGWNEETDQSAVSSCSTSAGNPALVSGTDTASATHTNPNRMAIVAASLSPAAIPCNTDPECDDSNPCTDDACVASFCEYTNNTISCDDGLYCTATDSCSGGFCVGGADPCTSGICNEAGDTCLAYAQITYEGFVEAKEPSDVSSVVLPLPAGTAEGDLLIAAVAVDGILSTPITPPVGEGWTQVDYGRGGTAVTFGVWWKLADVSESSTHLFTWTSVQQAYAWMMRFTGHDALGPVDVSNFLDGSTISSNPTSPAVTTTMPATMIVRLGGFDDDDVAIDQPG